jgi:hypothetical protein
LLVSAITIISVTKVHAEGTELGMKPIEPKGYEAQYYSGTMSWCCYDGKSACVPSNC